MKLSNRYRSLLIITLTTVYLFLFSSSFAHMNTTSSIISRSTYKALSTIPSKILRPMTFEELSQKLDKVSQKKKDSFLVTRTDIGDVKVLKNSANSIYHQVIQRSDIYGKTHEVFTLRFYLSEQKPDGTQKFIESNFYISGEFSEIKGQQVLIEFQRFLKEAVEKHGIKQTDVAAVEVIHSHPLFDVMLDNNNVHQWMISNNDITSAIKSFTGIVVVTAVVPNGYRYTMAIKNQDGKAENITAQILAN